jgi:hypothetical protein
MAIGVKISPAVGLPRHPPAIAGAIGTATSYTGTWAFFTTGSYAGRARMNPTCDGEESIRQNQTAQARHSPNDNPAQKSLEPFYSCAESNRSMGGRSALEGTLDATSETGGRQVPSGEVNCTLQSACIAIEAEHHEGSALERAAP